MTILEFRKSARKKVGEQHPEFLFAYLEQSGNKIVSLVKKLRFSHFNTSRQKAPLNRPEISYQMVDFVYISASESLYDHTPILTLRIPPARHYR